jgi:energy-converting hydrogenase Eha subunit A
MAALTVSICVIYSLSLKAVQQRRTLYEERKELPPEFWAYRSMRSRFKYALIFGIPLLAAALDQVIFRQTSFTSLLATVVLVASAILGLYLPSYVYGEFAKLVQEMRGKLPADSGNDRATMTMFALVAGGSSEYQVTTALMLFAPMRPLSY